MYTYAGQQCSGIKLYAYVSYYVQSITSQYSTDKKEKYVRPTHFIYSPSPPMGQQMENICFNMLHTSYCCGAQYFWV